jgi:RNA polymerase sigma factor (sigma-70 family)
MWTVSDLGSFYSSHRSELIAHAFRILKDYGRSEEVVQEALLKVLLAAPELKSEGHALGYVHRTIENICVDIFRIEGRRPTLTLIDEVAGEVESKWQSGEDQFLNMVAAEDAAIVRKALAMLSPAERSALVMWEMEGRPTKEIARELGIKEKSVRHTIARARSSFRRIMSEMIIDKERGLTGLDLLSNSYRKTSATIKKGSKVALSLFFFVFAFVWFSEVPNISPTPVKNSKEQRVPDRLIVEELTNEQVSVEVPTKPSLFTNKKPKVVTGSENIRSANLNFPGLDKLGVPTGYTVTDSLGALGSAYFFERPSVATETELISGQIIKTNSGSANVFISQTFTIDSNGLSYLPIVSYGRSGSWNPLLTRVSSTEITRLGSGNYMFTAFITVESEVESPIKIVATTNGRDLAAAPRQVITRMVLDSSKTKVLAQAIYVVEQGANA